jgi:methyl-accepting chemotaxis protein
MADEVENLSGKLGLDTSDFKTAVAGANRELRVLESSFKATAAGLGDWASTATGLESRIKSLTGQIDIQKLKVEALRAEHERLVAENGANSRAAQDAEIKLNQETQRLNEMTTELRETNGSLAEMAEGSEQAGGAVEDLGEKSEESGSKVETFKSILGGVATVAKATIGAVLALGTAAVATVGLLGGLALGAASAAEGIADMSAKTGISAERLQEYAYAGEIVGTSMDTIAGAHSKLIKSISTANQQWDEAIVKMDEARARGENWDDDEIAEFMGETGQAFSRLGVQIRDSSGALRDNEDVFADTIDALGRISNPTERDALAMQIFGKSAQELNPLIKAGSDELARLSEEAHKMGAVMSEEDVAAAAAFQDSLDGLKMGFQGILNQIGLEFIPGLSGLAGQAKGYLQEFLGVVQNARDASDQATSGMDQQLTRTGQVTPENTFLGSLVKGMSGLITEIVQDIAQQAPAMLQAGLSLIQSLLSALTSMLPQLLPVAVQIITSLVLFLVQNIPLILQAGIDIILGLISAIVPMLPMLFEAAIQILIALVQGIAAALPTLIPAAVQAIVTIVQALVENLPLLIGAALQLILGLAQGLIAAIPILLPAIPKIIEAIFNALITALPMIWDAASQLILMLIKGIFENLPLLAKTIVDLVTVIWKGITDGYPKLVQAGIDAIRGLWSGISSMGGWLLSQVKAFIATFLTGAVNDELESHSPSRVGIKQGRNYMGSIGQGVAEMADTVNRVMAAATEQMVAAAAGGLASGPSYSSSSTDNSLTNYGTINMSPARLVGAEQRIKARSW